MGSDVGEVGDFGEVADCVCGEPARTGFPGGGGKNRVFHTDSPGSYNMYYVKLMRAPVLPVLRTTPWLPSGSPWAAVESAPSPSGLPDPLLETLRYGRLGE